MPPSNAVTPLGVLDVTPSVAAMHQHPSTSMNPLHKPVMPAVVCGLSTTSWLRQQCIRAFFSEPFHVLMYLLIVGNAILLGFEEPERTRKPIVDPTNQETPDEIRTREIVNWLEMAFNVVFTFEMLVKMLAGGLWRGRFGYFRHKWNYLDFGLVLLGWVSVVLWLTLPADTASTPLPPMPTPPPYPPTSPPSPFPPDIFPPDTFAPDSFPPVPDDSPFPTFEPTDDPFTPVDVDTFTTTPPSDTSDNGVAGNIAGSSTPTTTPPSIDASGGDDINTVDSSGSRRLSGADLVAMANEDETLDPGLVDQFPSSTEPPNDHALLPTDDPNAFPPDDPNAFPTDDPNAFPPDDPNNLDPTFPVFPDEPAGLPDVATLSPDIDTTPSYLTTDFTAPAMAKNLASLFRLLRVFKVLRGIRLSKHAQALVLSLFESMRLLVNVIELLLVIFVLFAIAGVSLFQGALHQQCDNEYVTDGYLNVDTNGFLTSGNGFRCSMTPDVGRSCMADGVCVLNLTDDSLNKNPNFGFTSFDNVGLGLLSVIEIASLSDWGSTMWNLAEARGLIVGLYFVVVVPVGGYFIVNLVIAVVHNAYTQKWKDIRDEFVSAKLERKQKTLQAQKRKRRPSIIDMVVIKPLPATKLSHLELKTLATRFSSIDGRVKYKNFIEFFSPSSGVSNTVQNLREFLQSAKTAGLHSRSIFRFIDKNNSGDLSRDELVYGFQEIEERVGMKLDNGIVEALHDYLDVNNDGKVTLTEFIEFADPPSKASTLLEQKVLIELSGYEHAEGRVAAIFHDFDPSGTGTISMSQFRSALARIGFSGSGIKYLSRDDTLRLSMRSLDSFQSTSPLAVTWITWRRRIARFIRHTAFTGLVNVALVVQLVCFNLKSFDPIDLEVNASREAHIAMAQDAVAYVLGVEMGLKVTALGGRGYLVDKYNRFDGVLTLVGLGEAVCHGGGVALPVGVANAMLICRVLRLLQLFRQWTNFRVLVETMVMSFRGLLHFMFLLFVTMYIFALIGKHLFGNQMTEDRGFSTPFYSTFDTVWEALLTVFQVFTGDNWTDILYACMRVHAVTGAIYVVVMFFTGNYLVVNIFLSILMQDFESDENEHHRSYFSTIADADIVHYYDVVVNWITAFIDRYTPSPNRATSPRQQTKRRLRLKVQPMFSKLSSSFDSTSGNLDDKDDLNRLHEIADIVLFKMDTHTIEIGPRQYFECFHGFEAIQFLISSGFCTSVAEAEAMGNRLIELERFKCEAASIGRQADFDLQAVIQATNPRLAKHTRLPKEDDAEDAVLGILDELISAATQGVRYGPAGPFGNHTGVFSVHSSPWRNNIHAALEDAKEAHRHRDEVAASARDAKSQKFMVGSSLGLFRPNSRLRGAAKRILMHPYFKYLVLLVVLTSCVMSALEISDTEHASFYLWADVVISSLFFLEMTMKIVAQGFLFTGRYAYMRNGWNLLDFVVTVTSMLAVIFTFLVMHAPLPPCDPEVEYYCPDAVDVKRDPLIKMFRLFRALRPLRAIHLNPGMKVVVKAILITIPCVLNLAVILTIFLFMFAVVTVHFLAGKLWYCQGNSVDMYTLNATKCESDAVTTRMWAPISTSFDSIPNATLQLMESSTLESWSTVMHWAMDAPATGYAGLNPTRNNSPVMALLFVAFVVVCGFFMLGLFLGVIVYKFQQLKDEQNGTLFITEDQQKWVATQRRLFALKPKPAPSNNQLRGGRKLVFDIVVHPLFQGGMRVFILASIITLAMDHYPSTPRFDSAHTQVLWFFTAVNVVEAALMLYAHGYKAYLKQNWVDAIAVIVSVLDSFPQLRVLRILRLVRVYHLVSNSHSMVSILKTLTMSLPALLNVAALLILFAFVYAILGMNLFYDPMNPLYGQCIRDVVNFDSLSSAMMVLLVVVTGDNWMCYMHDVLPQYPAVGRWYFTSFFVVGNYIIMNLLIAVVMENFETYMDGFDESEGRPANAHLDAFADQWQKLAPNGSLFLPSYKLVALLRNVPPPLGFAPKKDDDQPPKSTKDIIRFIRSLHARRNHVHDMFYLDIFYTLCHHAMPNSFTVFEAVDIEAHLQAKLAGRALRHFKELHNLHLDTAYHRFDLTEEFNSVRVIQEAWKAYVAKKYASSPRLQAVKPQHSRGMRLLKQLTRSPWSARKRPSNAVAVSAAPLP